jgi:hypothetical protein
MYEIIFGILIFFLILGMIILVVYFTVADDIFTVIQPRIDKKLEDDNYLNTKNFTEHKKVDESIDTRIDTKIGKLPQGTTNVMDYVNAKVSDSVTTSGVTMDSKIEGAKKEIETKYDFLKKEGDSTTLNYQIGNPSLKDTDINLLNDVNINSELKVCNANATACYSFKVDDETNDLVIKKDTVNTPRNDAKIRINDHLYTKDYSQIDADGNTSNLDTILQNKLTSELANYPKKSEYTHTPNGTVQDSGIYPTKYSYVGHGVSSINEGVYPLKSHLDNFDLSQYATKENVNKVVKAHYHTDLATSGIGITVNDSGSVLKDNTDKNVTGTYGGFFKNL